MTAEPNNREAEAPNPNLTARDALTKAAEAFRSLQQIERNQLRHEAAEPFCLLAEQMEAALSTLVGAKTYEMGVDGGGREEMADIGEAFMSALHDYRSHSFLKGWAPADGPSEIIGDLLNALDEQAETLTPTNPGYSDCPHCKGAGFYRVLWSGTHQRGDKIACGNCRERHEQEAAR